MRTTVISLLAVPVLVGAGLAGCSSVSQSVTAPDASESSTEQPLTVRDSMLNITNSTGAVLSVKREAGGGDGQWHNDGVIKNGETRQFTGTCYSGPTCSADIALIMNDTFSVRANNPAVRSKWVSVSSANENWEQLQQISTLDDDVFYVEYKGYTFDFHALDDDSDYKRTNLTIGKCATPSCAR